MCSITASVLCENCDICYERSFTSHPKSVYWSDENELRPGQVSKSPEIIQKTDKYKMRCANENGYSVIRILQDDVWNDKNNWREKLKECIKLYDYPVNIFIGDVYRVYHN